MKNLPKHIVIIPDGNRRWAKQNNLKPQQGHKKGAEIAQNILTEFQKYGIKYLTIWGFSTENWKRSKIEIQYLMKLFSNLITKLKEKCKKDKIRFYHFGRKDRLPQSLIKKIIDLENQTKTNKKLHFALALDYGGRDEILRAVKKLYISNLDIDKLNEQKFSQFLDTKNFPDPDLIIRTGGEQRLSGIMLWQSAYSELYFLNKFFPDFNKNDIKIILEEFSKRQRRFGK